MMRFLMPLLGGLITIAGTMVGRVLIALGMGYATFRGFQVTVDWLLSQIKGNVGAMPTEVISFLGYLWVDRAIGMIFSAYSAAILVKLAGKTAITKLVMK